MEFDFEYISKLIASLLLAIAPVLAAQLSAFLFQAFKVKRAELGERQRFILDQAIQVAIYAAEQVYKAGNGDQKKAYALNAAEKYLAQYKITLDLDVLEAEIEAAVKLAFDEPALAQGEV